MPQEAAYSILLNLFFELVESQAGKGFRLGQEWLNDAKILAKKLYQHLVSMEIIAKGATVERDGITKTFFVDHASVKVVVRAAFETYLVFFHLYGNTDHLVSEFRHKMWRIGGLADRQKVHASSKRWREVKRSEKKQLEKLREEIKSSLHFRTYTERQRKKILEGNWRIGNSWADLGISAGFHEKYFKNIYGYLCGYSHSSYISIMQVGQAESIEDQRMLTKAFLGVGVVLMAHFAFSYSNIFRASKTVLHANPLATRVAKKWKFGQEDMAEIYDR